MNYKRQGLQNLFILAAYSGKTAEMKELLEEGASITGVFESQHNKAHGLNGKTAKQAAAGGIHEQKVLRFLQRCHLSR